MEEYKKSKIRNQMLSTALLSFHFVLFDESILVVFFPTKYITSGRTALHHAVEAHNPVAVRFLLTRRANVNAQTFSGNTPLHTASGRHMDAIISLLLDFNADPRLANAEGDPPLPETHRVSLDKQLILVGSDHLLWSPGWQ